MSERIDSKTSNATVEYRKRNERLPNINSSHGRKRLSKHRLWRCAWLVPVIVCSLIVSVVPTPANSALKIDNLEIIDNSIKHLRTWIPEEIKINQEQKFLENRGQLNNPDVRFYTIGNPILTGFTDYGMILVLNEKFKESEETNSDGIFEKDSFGSSFAFKIIFSISNNITPVGMSPFDDRSSFIVGREPLNWRTSVTSYREIAYRELYPNIDLRFYFKDGDLKYDLILHPGTNIEDVAFEYSDGITVEVESTSGDVLIKTPIGIMRDNHPIAYQSIEGVLTRIPCHFTQRGERTIGFAFDNTPFSGYDVVIDPGFKYGTFIGGSDQEWVYDIDVDEYGNVFVVGQTESPDFPMSPGCYDSIRNGSYDGYVAKLDPALSHLEFCTYIGGNDWDQVNEIVARPDGSSYLVGHTESIDFPTTANAYCTTMNGAGDAFYIILNSAGTDLLYSTFLGGESADDWATEISIDVSGNVFIIGSTESQNLPVTSGAYMTSLNGKRDGFVLKAKPDFTEILYCTYIGGVNNEGVFDSSLSPDGSLTLAGWTEGDFPTTPGAYSSSIFNDGYFVLRLNALGSDLIYSTYCPDGSDAETLSAVTTDSQGNVYLVGRSNSTDYPTTADAIDRSCDGYTNGFISVIADNGTKLNYSTFIHQDAYSCFNEVSIDDKGEELAIVGRAVGDLFPTTAGAFDDEYRDTAGYGDGILCVFNLTNSRMAYSTYIGGRIGDNLEIVEFGPNGTIWLCGDTDSRDFYTSQSAYSSEYAGQGDLIVVQIDPRPGKPATAPSSFQCVPSDWEVFINWSRPLDEGGCRVKYYELSRFNASTGQWDLLLQDYSFLYHDLNVTNGERYRYRICAVSNAGMGSYAEQSATVLAVLPSMPLNLTGTTGTSTVVLEWKPPSFDGGSRITGHIIMRGLYRDSMVELMRIGNETSWEDTTVELGTFYYYKVAAMNSVGTGPFSDTIRIKPLNLPSSPRSFSVVPGDDEVRLSWELPTSDGGMPLMGFRLYRGTAPDNFALLATRLITEPSFTDANVTNGMMYLYYVTAYTEFGESDRSTVLDAIPFGKPGVPTNLIVTAGDGEVLLSWYAPESDGGRAITGYKIFCGEDGGDIAFMLKIGNNTEFKHSDLVNGRTYSYKVRAVNEAGDSPLSESASAMPVGPPGAAGNLMAELVAGGVRLGWIPPIETGGVPSMSYDVLRGTEATALKSIATFTDVSEYIDENLNVGVCYYYQLRTFNEHGSGPLTEVVSIVFVAVPGPVANLTGKAGNARATLSWTAPLSDGGTPVVGYIVKRGLFESGLEEVKRIDSSASNYTDEGVDNGKTYYYAVFALNAVGVGATSPTINVTPRAPPGAPTGFQLRVEGATVVLTWLEPSLGGRAPVTGYSVMRGLSPDLLEIIAKVDGVQTYTDTTIEKGKTYYYTVMADSVSGLGDRTATIKATLKTEEDGPGFGVISTVIIFVIIAMLMNAMKRRQF